MAIVFLKDSTLTKIGDAIRSKLGTTAKLSPSQMANAINGIEVGDGTQIYPAEIYTQGGKGVPVTVSEPDEDGNKSLTIDQWMETPASDIVSGKKAVTNDGIVTGTHVCPTVQEMTADADATAADIASGKTAYVQGVKLTGEAEKGKATEVVEIAAISNPATAMQIYTSLSKVDNVFAVPKASGKFNITNKIYAIYNNIVIMASSSGAYTLATKAYSFSSGVVSWGTGNSPVDLQVTLIGEA